MLADWLFALARVAACTLASGHLAANEPEHALPGTPQPEKLSIGIAPGTWQGLNRNDATAAMAAWAKSILRQRNIAITVQTTLFESGEELAKSLGQKRIDCASMSTDQFYLMNPSLQPDEVFVSESNLSATEEYVVLVRNDSSVRSVADLQGRKLVVQSTVRTSLALAWLDLLLADKGLGAPQSVVSELVRTDKPSKAVLPVFFRQADSCLTTSNAFEVASELNPQLRRELQVLAISPKVVPAVFFFRRDYASPARDQLEPAILSLHQNPAGVQLLTVFQCDRLVKYPVSSLGSTYELLRKGQRLRNAGAANEPRLTANPNRKDG